MYKTLAIINAKTNNMTWVPPLISTGGDGGILTHESPRIQTKNGKLLTNFDYLLHVDESRQVNHELRAALRHRYIFVPMATKAEQFFQIKKHNDINSKLYQIDAPQALFAFGRPNNLATPLLVGNVGIPNTKRIVIKPQSGARGNKQLLIHAHNLPTVLNHGCGLTTKELIEKFPYVVAAEETPEDHIFWHEGSDLSHLYFCEYVANISEEYRLLWDGTQIWYRQRHINSGLYPQANLSYSDFKAGDEVEYIHESEGVLGQAQDFIHSLHVLLDSINLPFGSVDAYRTTEDTWGILEYSAQFAARNTSMSFLTKLHKEAIINLLNKRRKQDELVLRT